MSSKLLLKISIKFVTQLRKFFHREHSSRELQFSRRKRFLYIREKVWKIFFKSKERKNKQLNFNVSEPATNEIYKHIEVHPGSHEIKKNVFKCTCGKKSFFPSSLRLKLWNCVHKKLWMSIVLFLLLFASVNWSLFWSQVQIHSISTSFQWKIFCFFLLSVCSLQSRWLGEELKYSE